MRKQYFIPKLQNIWDPAVYRNTFRLSEKEQGKSYALQFSKLGGAACVLVNGCEALAEAGISDSTLYEI